MDGLTIAYRRAFVAAMLFFLASGPTARANDVTRHHGRCQSLTVLDRRDALRCIDEMIVQAEDGQRGFVFRTDHAVVLFVTIDQRPDATGLRDLAMSRVEFAVGGQVETIPVLSGSCRSVDPASTWRAETTCVADTTKGRFAAQFVTIDGAAETMRPSDGAR